MRVDIAAGVFHAPDALTDLLNLLRCFAEGRHDWVADPAVIDASRRYFTGHAPHFVGGATELAAKGTVATAWTGSSDPPLTVRIEPENLAQYASDLCQAAVLVVEDQDSDGHFVGALAEIFRAERLRRALAEDWLQIGHGGGGSLAKVAKSATEHFQLCVRVAALLDSDRLVPGARTASHTKADSLVGLGIVVHVLELREAENYVPNKVLARCGRPREASSKLELLKRLSPEQRGYFDMKDGFKRADAVPSAQSGLFSGLDDRILRGLGHGFGTDLLHRLSGMKEDLTEHDFAALGTDVVPEIRRLLCAIASVI